MAENFNTYEEYIINELKNFKKQANEQIQTIVNLQQENERLKNILDMYKKDIEKINQNINNEVERRLQEQIKEKESFYNRSLAQRKSKETMYKNQIVSLEKKIEILKFNIEAMRVN